MLSLFDLPHHEAAGVLRRGVPVFLTVNPVEYHGPHLSLHNDLLISRGLARDVHQRLAQRHPEWPLVLADDLELGVGATPGPGTRSLSYAHARAVVESACRGLLSLGARRVVFLTFHGDPLHNRAISEGVALLERHGVRAVSPFNVLMEDMVHFESRFDLDRGPLARAFAHVANVEERSELKRRLPFDVHAGFFETSLALHYAPESVSPLHRELPPCPRVPKPRAVSALRRLASGLARLPRQGLGSALGTLAGVVERELAFVAEVFGWLELDPFPGYTSSPRHASAAAGAVFAEYLTERFADEVLQVLDGERPGVRPILSWAHSLSLGGRLGGIPAEALGRVLGAIELHFERPNAEAGGERRGAHRRRTSQAKSPRRPSPAPSPGASPSPGAAHSPEVHRNRSCDVAVS